MIPNLSRRAAFSALSAVFVAYTAFSQAQDASDPRVAAATSAALAQGISPQAIEQFKADQGLGSAATTKTIKASPQLTPLPAGSEDSKSKSVGLPGFDANLRPFGAELFSGSRGRYITPTDLPVPADYIVGIGDTVEVRLFGKENRVLSLPVQRNGTVVLPDIGDISVVGLTLEAMGKLVLERIAKKKSASKRRLAWDNCAQSRYS